MLEASLSAPPASSPMPFAAISICSQVVLQLKMPGNEVGAEPGWLSTSIISVTLATPNAVVQAPSKLQIEAGVHCWK